MTQIFAHRGASAAAGDNTVAAFELAVAMGADGVELDVRLTADRELAVHHDPSLPDGRAIADVDARDLPGHIVLIDVALDACEPLLVNVEIKNSPDEPGFADPDELAERVCGPLVRRNTDDRWIVSSFNLATVHAVRARFPRLTTALLTDTVDPEAIERAATAGVAAINPDQRTVTPAAIQRARTAGLEVWPWTVDDGRRLTELIEWGVDGLFTNYPDRAIGLRDRWDRREKPT